MSKLLDRYPYLRHLSDLDWMAKWRFIGAEEYNEARPEVEALEAAEGPFEAVLAPAGPGGRQVACRVIICPVIVNAGSGVDIAELAASLRSKLREALLDLQP